MFAETNSSAAKDAVAGDGSQASLAGVVNDDEDADDTTCKWRGIFLEFLLAKE